MTNFWSKNQLLYTAGSKVKGQLFVLPFYHLVTFNNVSCILKKTKSIGQKCKK